MLELVENQWSAGFCLAHGRRIDGPLDRLVEQSMNPQVYRCVNQWMNQSVSRSGDRSIHPTKTDSNEWRPCPLRVEIFFSFHFSSLASTAGRVLSAFGFPDFESRSISLSWGERQVGRNRAATNSSSFVRRCRFSLREGYEKRQM